jgi:hypothetical protein
MYDILVIYDDSLQPNAEIKNIIGEKSFGSVIFQRKSLQRHFLDALLPCAFVKEVVVIDGENSWYRMKNSLAGVADRTPVLHVYADSVIRDEEEFAVLLEKTRFAKQNIKVMAGELAAIIFSGTEEYARFLERGLPAEKIRMLPEDMSFESMQSGALGNIGETNGFLQYLTNAFDARHFNSLSGDRYVVTKCSQNKEKIKKEYKFYHLLPEHMKMWFVRPFDYREEGQTAQYSMQRYHITDLAVKWVNGSIGVQEFRTILETMFYFLRTRDKQEVSSVQYRQTADGLYIHKVERRIEEMKRSAIYTTLVDFLDRGTAYESIDALFAAYRKLYEQMWKKKTFLPISVIGHGDLCFSNTLYHRETGMMKLIDVKGALTEEELWTDPYYDLAKLSHSICGNYDFFNSSLYEIKLSPELQFELSVDFDNREYVDLFQAYLQQSGYDYAAVRLFEASLFLSMLPLHIDFPKKVFGFLLNAINILNEVSECLKK